jgi:hypothetical protein
MGAFRDHYDTPRGMCWDAGCIDEPIMDNPNLDEYNLDAILDMFNTYARTYV